MPFKVKLGSLVIIIAVLLVVPSNCDGSSTALKKDRVGVGERCAHGDSGILTLIANQKWSEV